MLLAAPTQSIDFEVIHMFKDTKTRTKRCSGRDTCGRPVHNLFLLPEPTSPCLIVVAFDFRFFDHASSGPADGDLPSGLAVVRPSDLRGPAGFRGANQ